MKQVKGYLNALPLMDRSGAAKSLAASITHADSSKESLQTEKSVQKIIDRVREQGDNAIKFYSRKFDRVQLDSLEVQKDEIDLAYKIIGDNLIEIFQLAAKRISDFHNKCKNNSVSGFSDNGLGRRVSPLERVGIYVPGGTASYPSTVLMTAIPARVAGVKNIIMVTPPGKNGLIPPSTLVAADIAKIDQVFKVGGAQAIAALAYGTESIPKVDKICGPGNIFVATAKKMVFGDVGIDAIQGPSEIIVLADDSAPIVYCAADLIAQAEHDPMASAIFLTTSERIFDNIEQEIFKQLEGNNRKATALLSLNKHGLIVLVNEMSEALNLVNIHAPEHLLIMSQNAEDLGKNVINAGGVFIGVNSPVVMGDYIAGPSHVLPTGGTARFSSPLSIEDFVKVTNFVSFKEKDILSLGQKVIDFAAAEGLTGHANAAEIRLKVISKSNEAHY